MEWRPFCLFNSLPHASSYPRRNHSILGFHGGSPKLLCKPHLPFSEPFKAVAQTLASLGKEQEGRDWAVTREG